MRTCLCASRGSSQTIRPQETVTELLLEPVGPPAKTQVDPATGLLNSDQ
jgi:hypothetical protein